MSSTNPIRQLAPAAIIACLACATAAWASPRLEIGEGNATVYSSGAGIVPVSYESDVPAVAIQFDVQFDPARLVSAPTLLGGLASDHLVVSSEPTPGTRRVVVYSPENSPLPNGVLLDLQFLPLAQSPDGPVSLVPANVIVVGKGPVSITPVVALPGTFTIGTPARFGSVTVSPAGLVELELTGPVGATFALQRSPDLNQWTSIATNAIPPGGVLHATDPSAVGAAARFYRAVQR